MNQITTTTGSQSPEEIVNNNSAEKPQQQSDINAYNLENIGPDPAEKPERKEHTRSKMAILFVLGFFAILFLCFIYAMQVKASLSDLKDTLIGVIGALSGTLGFIVGYYYKASFDQ